MINNVKNPPHAIENPRYRIITIDDPTALASEAYRKIKVSLDYSSIDKKLKTIVFTSALQGEGKSITLLNIASCYAETGKKTIVVDLDFRRPKIHRAFDVENEHGITDVLAGKISLKEAIKHSEHLPFDGLNRGTKIPNPYIMIGSDELTSLFKTLADQYDVVLIDCPPLLAVSDTLTFLERNKIDGTVFVVSQKNSDKKASKEAVELLKSKDVNVVGAVVSQLSEKYSENYSYSRYCNTYYGNK